MADKRSQTGNPITRRSFLNASAAAAFTIVPPNVLGKSHTPPSEKLNIACIGIGGRGSKVLAGMHTENIVALCDVDLAYAAPVFDYYPEAKQYRDWRVMLQKQKDIDAVIIATPDHTHTVITLAAMQMGKHVYTEKPLTHSIYEARVLTEAAKKYNVVTQMGNQGHSSEGIRLIKEWIEDGAIGPVREVHAWTDRPSGIWPQGVSMPQEKVPTPDTMDWDLWLGPAPYRDYHPAYAPFFWRGRWDFGTGALGDMACHIVDPIYWALDLGHPKTVEARYAVVGRENTLDESPPVASIIYYEFDARGDKPALNMTWYDGGLMPRRPEILEPGRKMGSGGGGVLFVGDKGTIMCGCYASSPRLIPESAMKAYTQPKQSIERIPKGDHQLNFVNACKGRQIPSASFDYAGPLTEMVLIGNLAVRNAGKKLQWDSINLKVTNAPEADPFIKRQYRKGWTL